MRTVIFIGLLSIADAIRPDWLGEANQVIVFMSIVLAASIIMDLIEWYKNVTRKQ